jgi:opacity protein-like surface antigen
MKPTFWTAAVSTALGLTGHALAADAPAYVPNWAPPPVVYVVDWNGFYIGAHLGGAWQDHSAQTVIPSTGTVLETTSGSDASFAGGGQIGINYAFWTTWMFGIEADISGTLLHGSSITSDTTGTTQVQNDNKTDMFGTVRGRAGYIWDNWLFYGTGGFAWSDANLARTQLMGTTGGAGPGTVDRLYGITTGWVAGAGLEWAFSPKWTVRIEYLHLDLGSSASQFTSSGLRRDVSSTIEVARVGLNYRFNLLSLAP